jgi:hypothetical protein
VNDAEVSDDGNNANHPYISEDDHEDESSYVNDSAVVDKKKAVPRVCSLVPKCAVAAVLDSMRVCLSAECFAPRGHAASRPVER